MQNLADARRRIGDYFARAFSREVAYADEPFGFQDSNNITQMFITGRE